MLEAVSGSWDTLSTFRRTIQDPPMDLVMEYLVVYELLEAQSKRSNEGCNF
jgi:hypothetical protein